MNINQRFNLSQAALGADHPFTTSPRAHLATSWLALACILTGCSSTPTQPSLNATWAVEGATAAPSTSILGTTVAFSARTTNPNLVGLTYQWDFGDGSSSADAAPSHTYQSAGTFAARVTVSDGKTSVPSQTTVTVKTLTGTWQSSSVSAGAFGTTDFNFRMTQNGTTLTVTAAPFTNSLVSISECPWSGSVKSSSPRITLAGSTCSAVFNGATIQVGGNTLELDPSADGDTLTGTLLPTPRPITFARR